MCNGRIEANRIVREKRSALCREQMGVGWLDARAVVEVERTPESVDEARNMLERSSEKHRGSRDGPAAGESAERLLDDGIERACGDIALLRPRIEQRTHVGLGEHGATRCDRVGFGRSHCKAAHLFGRYAEHERDGVDEAPCAAGARCVHALFEPASEVDDLRVLAAELYDGIGFGDLLLHDAGGCDDFLDEGYAEHLGQLDARRARYGYGACYVSVAPYEIVRHFGKRSLDVGSVSAVCGALDGAVLVENDDLDGFGACVYAYAVRHRYYLYRKLAKYAMRLEA